jgi:hypothetical protein
MQTAMVRMKARSVVKHSGGVQFGRVGRPVVPAARRGRAEQAAVPDHAAARKGAGGRVHGLAPPDQAVAVREGRGDEAREGHEQPPPNDSPHAHAAGLRRSRRWHFDAQDAAASESSMRSRDSTNSRVVHLGPELPIIADARPLTDCHSPAWILGQTLPRPCRRHGSQSADSQCV